MEWKVKQLTRTIPMQYCLLCCILLEIKVSYVAVQNRIWPGNSPAATRHANTQACFQN